MSVTRRRRCNSLWVTV